MEYIFAVPVIIFIGGVERSQARYIAVTNEQKNATKNLVMKFKSFIAHFPPECTAFCEEKTRGKSEVFLRENPKCSEFEAHHRKAGRGMRSKESGDDE